FNFNAVDGQARGIARLDTASQTWHTLEGGMNPGAGPSALAVYGEELIAGGGFSKAGNTTVRGLARWGGAEQPGKRTAPGVDITPSNFTTYHGELIASGSFGCAGDVEALGVARFDGQAWHALGSGIADGAVVGAIDVLGVYDDRLIVGGYFNHAGGVPVQNIA